jgi:hypothetical protein
MKNIKRVIVLVAALGAIATAFFMVFMKNMPNVFDWDLDDE